MSALRRTAAAVSPSCREDARRRVLNLYRNTVKYIPALLRAYEMPDGDPVHTRKYVRDRFEKNRGITDVDMINLLRFKGETELNEAMNLFFSKSHVSDICRPRPEPSARGSEPEQIAPHQSEFLTQFLKQK